MFFFFFLLYGVIALYFGFNIIMEEGSLFAVWFGFKIHIKSVGWIESSFDAFHSSTKDQDKMYVSRKGKSETLFPNL